MVCNGLRDEKNCGLIYGDDVILFLFGKFSKWMMVLDISVIYQDVNDVDIFFDMFNCSFNILFMSDIKRSGNSFYFFLLKFCYGCFGVFWGNIVNNNVCVIVIKIGCQ